LFASNHLVSWVGQSFDGCITGPGSKIDRALHASLRKTTEIRIIDFAETIHMHEFERLWGYKPFEEWLKPKG